MFESHCFAAKLSLKIACFLACLLTCLIAFLASFFISSHFGFFAFTQVRHLHAHFPLASLHALGAVELTECHRVCVLARRMLLSEVCH
jgi:hypothetical protein